MTAFDHPRHAVALQGFMAVYSGPWGLKASEEDAVLGILEAVYPDDFAPFGGAEGIYKMRGDAALCDAVDACSDIACEGLEAVDTVARMLPVIDAAMQPALLRAAAAFGVDVEEARFDPWFLAELLWELRGIADDQRRAAAVRAVNDGARTSDWRSYAEEVQA